MVIIKVEPNDYAIETFDLHMTNMTYLPETEGNNNPSEVAYEHNSMRLKERAEEDRNYLKELKLELKYSDSQLEESVENQVTQRGSFENCLQVYFKI
jgi:hypothetical protein